METSRIGRYQKDRPGADLGPARQRHLRVELAVETPSDSTGVDKKNTGIVTALRFAGIKSNAARRLQITSLRSLTSHPAVVPLIFPATRAEVFQSEGPEPCYAKMRGRKAEHFHLRAAVGANMRCGHRRNVIRPSGVRFAFSLPNLPEMTVTLRFLVGRESQTLMKTPARLYTKSCTKKSLFSGPERCAG